MFSLFKRLVIAIEKIAANSIGANDYIEYQGMIVEMQKIKSIEILKIQEELNLNGLFLRAKYKQAKGIELTVDEQIALESSKGIEQRHIFHIASYKKANGIELTAVEEKALENN